MRRPPPAQAGFTVLELMLVITVAAVILGLGVPNFRAFMLNSRMTSSANDVLVGIHAARTEAVKRHQQVIMCFSTSPDANPPVCGGDGTQGWVVFVDDRNPDVVEGNDNNGVPDADEPVVLRHKKLPDGVGTRPMPAGNAGYIAYNPAGFARKVAAVGEMFNGIVMCDGRGNKVLTGNDNSAARAIIVSTTGRPRVTRVVTDITLIGACP